MPLVLVTNAHILLHLGGGEEECKSTYKNFSEFPIHTDTVPTLRLDDLHDALPLLLLHLVLNSFLRLEQTGIL